METFRYSLTILFIVALEKLLDPGIREPLVNLCHNILLSRRGLWHFPDVHFQP